MPNSTKPISSKPNILFISCHDLGRHLGCYGIPTVRSPELDRLAAEGVRFTNHFCTAPQCSPSRATIATGRYAHANGMHGLAHSPFDWSLHPNERPVARLLADAGYATTLVGVQHITRNPTHIGFQRRLPDPPRQHASGCDDVADLAVGALNELAAGDAPFYLEVGFFEPHLPFNYGGATPDEELGVTVPPFLPDNAESRRDFAAMQGAIHKVDGAIGRVLDALRRSDAADNTVAIFTTDHGIPLPRAKCTLYDSGIGVAFLLRWPERGLTGGRTVDALTSHVDMLPTLLEAVDVAAPENLHGNSLLPLLTGGDYTPRETVFAEKSYHNIYDPMRGLRTNRYKYIRNFEANNIVEAPADARRTETYRMVVEDLCVNGNHPPVELYDLATDPGEWNNLAGQDDYAEVRRELDAKLIRWMRETGDPLLEGPIPSNYYQRVMAGL